MSERMSDEYLKELRDKATTYGDLPSWDVETLCVEVQRSRAAEAEQQRQLDALREALLGSFEYQDEDHTAREHVAVCHECGGIAASVELVGASLLPGQFFGHDADCKWAAAIAWARGEEVDDAQG